MKIGLIPLDERPVNTRYPAMIAQIVGIDLELPQPEILSHFHQPAQLSMLGDWLSEHAANLQALIVSLEMFGYGSLIASRTSQDSTGAILARLDRLCQASQSFPALKITGFNLITRVSNADSSVEEPQYWATEGKQIYRYSQLLDRKEQGEAVDDEIATLESALPAEHLGDFLQRRLRNHAVNLAAIHMLASGDLDGMVLSSDDTSPFGLPSSEKRILNKWVSRLGLEDRLLMYPGADEVGCALLARVFNQEAGFSPGFQVGYAIPGGEKIVAPFEDSPVSVTIERQIRAVGGRLVDSRADFWLAVNPPVPRRSEWNEKFADQERHERLPHLQKMVKEIRSRLEAGQAVIVADVAYPNGADPVLVELLLDEVEITRLAAYGAWNTAGNTIGTALAQGCASLLVQSAAQKEAGQCFLLHRFLEDWGYQQEVRRETWKWMMGKFGAAAIDPQNQSATLACITAGLEQRLAQLPGFAGKFQLKQGSVRLPWNRLFEVDFDLVKT